MSLQSAAGTTSNIDATLNAILRCLDAIELKMEPLQPLQDQVATLETAVQDQAAQQQELDAAVNHLAGVHGAHHSSHISGSTGTTTEPSAVTSPL
jgi:cell division FtsZ-interacting protein ZapD